MVSVFRHVEAMPKHRMVGKMFKRFFAPLRMTEFSRAVFYIPLAPLWEADCELRANRLAEVQDCVDPLNASNQAG